jgi:hypothetical protein
MSSSSTPPTVSAPAPAPARAGIDPRGPRFTAGVSALLAIGVLLLGTGAAALAVLAVLVVSFLLGVVRGPAGTWTGWVFRTAVRPRLTPPTELEDPRPPRFAQLVGLVLSGLGLLLGLVGVGPAIPVSAALVLVASFLNAVFGLCLGCELYLLGLRVRARRAAAAA